MCCVRGVLAEGVHVVRVDMGVANHVDDHHSALQVVVMVVCGGGGGGVCVW